MALSELLGIEGYRPPAQAQVSLLTATDGVKLRAARWRPSARKGPMGSVLVLGGRSEFIERYSETIAELRRRGFHVASFDWRGQGGSDRLTANPLKGHVRRFADYHLDLQAGFDQLMARLPRPWFVLAHSMGAAICLESSAQGRFKADRLVALAPMLKLAIVPDPRAARLLAGTLDWLGFGSAFVPFAREVPLAFRPFEGNRLSSDPVRYARGQRLAAELPQLQVADPTIRWVHHAFRFMERVGDPSFALDVRTPSLVIAAGEDPLVSSPAIEQFAARLKTGMALALPGARHEILNETDAVRERFWAAFDAFIPGELKPVNSSPPVASGVEEGEGGVVDTPVA